MSERNVRIAVKILEKEYQIACPPEERAALLDSAEYLNMKMREIRDGGNVIGIDRIAVMAALNLAAELLKIKSRESSSDSDVGHRIRNVRERVESALEKGRQMEI